MVQFQAALASDHFEKAGALWDELARSRSSPEELKAMVTARLGAKASTPALRREWLRRLKVTREDMGPSGSFLPELNKEIERVEAGSR